MWTVYVALTFIQMVSFVNSYRVDFLQPRVMQFQHDTRVSSPSSIMAFEDDHVPHQFPPFIDLPFFSKRDLIGPIRILDMYSGCGHETDRLYHHVTTTTHVPFDMYGIEEDVDSTQSAIEQYYHPRKTLHFECQSPLDRLSSENEVLILENDLTPRWYIYQYCIDKIPFWHYSLMTDLWAEMVLHHVDIMITFRLSILDTSSYSQMLELSQHMMKSLSTRQYKTDTSSPPMILSWTPLLFHHENDLWITFTPNLNNHVSSK